MSYAVTLQSTLAVFDLESFFFFAGRNFHLWVVCWNNTVHQGYEFYFAELLLGDTNACKVARACENTSGKGNET